MVLEYRQTQSNVKIRSSDTSATSKDWPLAHAKSVTPATIQPAHKWVFESRVCRHSLGHRHGSHSGRNATSNDWLTFSMCKVLDFCNHYSDGEQTSEFYQDGIFLEGPQLPNPMNSHCAVEVEPGFVFMGGNYYFGGEKVFSFDPATGAFESLADMTQERYGHGCGVVDKGDS